MRGRPSRTHARYFCFMRKFALLRLASQMRGDRQLTSACASLTSVWREISATDRAQLMSRVSLTYIHARVPSITRARHTHTHLHTHSHSYTHTYTHTYKYICIFIRGHTHIHSHTLIYTHACTCMLMHVHTHVYTCNTCIQLHGGSITLTIQGA